MGRDLLRCRGLAGRSGRLCSRHARTHPRFLRCLLHVRGKPTSARTLFAWHGVLMRAGCRDRYGTPGLVVSARGARRLLEAAAPFRRCLFAIDEFLPYLYNPGGHPRRGEHDLSQAYAHDCSSLGCALTHQWRWFASGDRGRSRGAAAVAAARGAALPRGGGAGAGQGQRLRRRRRLTKARIHFKSSALTWLVTYVRRAERRYRCPSRRAVITLFFRAGDCTHVSHDIR